MYHEAMLDLNLLSDHSTSYNYFRFISYIYLLREYTDFWLYLNVNNNDDLSELGIVNGFSKHMYEKSQVYFISDLVNFDSGLYQFQENDINSLSGKIISSKNEELCLNFPMLIFGWRKIIWKINVKEILNKDCFINFKIKSTGLGWIEYQLPIDVYEYYVQPSIEINGSINMQIDYVRFGNNKEKITYIPNIPNIVDLFLNFHNIYPNVPEIFKDKYFSRKEMENLLELKDIINHL
ncbi:hypothetical protein RhiirB3_436961 [Rhizophagus irregularis]|nr:hypothetical protein RhiirB3_436961 [Rhizophagus irregularis]